MGEETDSNYTKLSNRLGPNTAGIKAEQEMDHHSKFTSSQEKKRRTNQKRGEEIRRLLEEKGYIKNKHIDFADEGKGERIVGDLGDYIPRNSAYALNNSNRNQVRSISVFRLAGLAGVDTTSSPVDQKDDKK